MIAPRTRVHKPRERYESVTLSAIFTHHTFSGLRGAPAPIGIRIPRRNTFDDNLLRLHSYGARWSFLLDQAGSGSAVALVREAASTRFKAWTQDASKALPRSASMIESAWVTGMALR